MSKNRYKEEFSNYIGIMKEALDRGNFAAYEAAKQMLDESIGECKHEYELCCELNTNNFGILNHIFEDRLPELFRTNKKAVRDVIKLIKEDKNLYSEFNYYNTLRQYRGKITDTIPAELFESKLENAVCENIDKDSVIKSNSRLRKLMKEHNIIPTDFINPEMKKLYESGHNIMTKKRGIGNLALMVESSKNVSDYIERHKNDAARNEVDPQALIEDFENRLKDTLTESEISFVQQITDWRSPIAEHRKEKLFNKFKNECIDKVNEMLSEDAGNIELESLKKQLEDKKFNNTSIVEDIAKLLEIRDILLDK